MNLAGYIANIPPKQRIALGITLVAFLAVGYWQFFLKSEWAARGEARTELLRLKAEAEQTRQDRKSTRLNSSHIQKSRMPSSA